MKKLLILWLSLLWTIFLVMAGMTLGQATVPKETPRPYQVTDKDEFGGRCYVQTWIEVTPEDYIGLEVGDEFNID